MDLFYTKGEEKIGPCTRKMIRQAEMSGDLNSETLSWHEGMDDWQGWGTVKATPAVQAFLETFTTCVMCAKDVPRESVVEFGKDLICAGCKETYLQRLREGCVDPTGKNVWRKKKILIITPQAELPDRCVKCNDPANGYRKKVKMSKTSLILFLVIGLLSLLFSKRYTLEVGLCQACRKKRVIGILCLVAGVIVALFGTTASGFISRPLVSGTAVIASAVIGIGLMVVGGFISSLLQVLSIKPDYVRITGAGKKFLNSLPEFDG